MKVAFVVFVIGEDYQKRFQQYFYKSVQTYCNKHGYELKILDRFIMDHGDENSMPKKLLFWQRLLIPSLFPDYDYVISLDSDIYINPNSPPLPFHEIPEGKVGAVNERKYFQNYGKSAVEINLIEDLYNEAINIQGFSGYYIPNTNIQGRDLIYGDDPLKHFDNAYKLDMYLVNTMDYGEIGRAHV